MQDHTQPDSMAGQRSWCVAAFTPLLPLHQPLPYAPPLQAPSTPDPIPTPAATHTIPAPPHFLTPLRDALECRRVEDMMEKIQQGLSEAVTEGARGRLVRVGGWLDLDVGWVVTCCRPS